MNQPKTLMFIGAHPDDETFGLGATLAQYAAAGVQTYYVCATRGEAGTIDPELLRGYASPGDLRWAELNCAAQVLGLRDIIYLGYRDSGMPGAADNRHPEALIMAPLEEVAGRMVKAIRQVRPQVVITFDPIGGYRHPDHIVTHNAAVKAFAAAAEAALYPEAGPPFQPAKLYFHIMPRRIFRLAVRLMPLIGQDPHHFGRNKDVDLTQFVNVEYPVHAFIRLRKQSLAVRDRAMTCHTSQLGGSSPRRGLLGTLNKLFGQKDHFMRAYPVPRGKLRESDLFTGI
jgi:N-acetyl-1-D-myo-inositol-2-amino-2-deoxy-alpha-D-glucopyranoside deacetylase